MKLSAYLNRIGFDGDARPDIDTLRAVHRRHVEAIPYENLDVQFGVPVSRAPEAAFDKIVTRRRGGWCYEMNGLLGWALQEIGFKVERLAGAVERRSRGDFFIGNHLVLIVTLDGSPWLADAGFGDGLIEPQPLAVSFFRNGPLSCRLEQDGDGWFRYHNDERAGGMTFDFHRGVADETLLESMCRWLQTDAQSPFVLNAVVQRWDEDAHYSLRGRVLTVHDADGRRSETVDSADDYVALLRDRFLLDLPEAESLWPKICARHEAVFASAAQ